jgi:hypothetical protein
MRVRTRVSIQTCSRCPSKDDLHSIAVPDGRESRKPLGIEKRLERRPKLCDQHIEAEVVFVAGNQKRIDQVALRRVSE